jgi:hypothetical protein
MHLKIFLLLLLLILLGLLCLLKSSELRSLRAEAHKCDKQKQEILQLLNYIGNHSLINCIKSMESTFSRTQDPKALIENIAREHIREKIFFRHLQKRDSDFNVDDVVIRFSSHCERETYNFVNEIYAKFDGIITCDSLQIIKNNKNGFTAKITLKIYSPTDKTKADNIFLHHSDENLSPQTKKIKLFPSDELPRTYTLHCVLNNSKAFINNFWLNAGETRDDFKIKNIFSNAIEVEQDEKIFSIKIGGVWTVE